MGSSLPALVGICAWLLLVENLLIGDLAGVGEVGRLLPGAAGRALSGQDPSSLLAPVAGLLLPALYAASADGWFSRNLSARPGLARAEPPAASRQGRPPQGSTECDEPMTLGRIAVRVRSGASTRFTRMAVRSSGHDSSWAPSPQRPRPGVGASRRVLSALVLAAVGLAALLAFGAAVATTEPAAIEAKRAELARVQAQLSAFNTQVEQAAEAYNGARYQLGLVSTRIDENTRLVKRNEKDLESSRRVLADRLRNLYATPEPSLIDVLVTSGSITAAADQLELLDRVGEQDAEVVGGLRDHKETLEKLRKQLLEDRDTAAAAVASREREKARVEDLLAQRQAVLDNASAELKGLLKAEEERKAREAAVAAAAARQRQTAAAVTASTPTTETPDPASGTPSASDPAASAAPTTSVAGSSANASAAQYALEFLGVPYVWGGASPSGFDCSGLATYVFAKYGKSVPHYTGAIWSAFPHVSASDLQVGDLVFFHGLGHMGIYLGGDQFVHAPHTGDVVKVSQFSTYSGYVGAVRP